MKRIFASLALGFCCVLGGVSIAQGNIAIAAIQIMLGLSNIGIITIED